MSRQRNDTDRFPDVARAAAAQLDDGAVVDGELVIMVDGRLSFDALQRRLVTTPAKARQMVASIPASYVAFDLLAYGGVDLRTQRWTTEAMGIEGLAVKGASSRYVGARREWLKVMKRRDTVEVICGGVIGPIERPEVVIAGRYLGGDLVVVGRTVPLTDAQSAELAAVLRPARRNHPWPDEISSQRWAGRDSKKPLTKTRPDDVVEVSADAAIQASQWRHPLRYAGTAETFSPMTSRHFPSPSDR
ncbi:ATP-dependent DNA ligase [Kribbella lupini]|uniref:ATP-dependent DNA ligase n=1 Tax=Kribbella lupini TaxID=291602 RepID=A0ABN2B075_9ACTN